MLKLWRTWWFIRMKFTSRLDNGRFTWCTCVVGKYFKWSSGEVRASSLQVCFPDSKVNGANTRPIWGRQDPGESHEFCYLGKDVQCSRIACEVRFFHTEFIIISWEVTKYFIWCSYRVLMQLMWLHDDDILDLNFLKLKFIIELHMNYNTGNYINFI